MNLRWQHFPRSQPPSALCRQTVEVFERKHASVDSRNHDYNSDKVLSLLADDLRLLGFQIEKGKKKDDKIAIPVLFGENGRISKAFHTDGYHSESKYMLEVEAGRGFTNYQFLKDLFQACSCDNVDSLAVAVRNDYKGSDDFSKVCTFMDTVFSSRRFALPLKEVLVSGY
jgi:hypothetical protein